MVGSSKFRLESMEARYGFNIVAVKIEQSTGLPILYAQFSHSGEQHDSAFALPSVETAVVKSNRPKKGIVSPNTASPPSDRRKPSFFPEFEDNNQDYYDSEEL